MKNICDHRRVLSFLGWVRAGMGKPAWLAQGALLSLPRRCGYPGLELARARRLVQPTCAAFPRADNWT